MNRVSEARQNGKRPARLREGVALWCQVVDLGRVTIIEPELGRAESLMEGYFARRSVCNVDLNEDVRRRIDGRIELALAGDGSGVLDVEARVRLRALSELLPPEGRRAETLEIAAQFVRYRIRDAQNQVFALFVLGRGAHDRKLPLIIMDSYPVAIAEIDEKPLVRRPRNLGHDQRAACW